MSEPIRRRYGKEIVEIDSAQKARDMARNKALPLSNAERDQLRRDADGFDLAAEMENQRRGGSA